MNIFDYLMGNQSQQWLGQAGVPMLGQNGPVWTGPRPGGASERDKRNNPFGDIGGGRSPAQMQIYMTPWGEMTDQYGDKVSAPPGFKAPQWPGMQGGMGQPQAPGLTAPWFGFTPPPMQGTGGPPQFEMPPVGQTISQQNGFRQAPQVGSNGGVAFSAQQNGGAGDIGGLVSSIMPQPMYNQQALGEIGNQMGSTMQAAQNIMGGMLPEMGQAASNDQQLRGFNFQGAGGQNFGNATVGAPPGMTPMGGMGQMTLPNMGIAPQQFWGPQQSQQLSRNFGALKSSVMPSLSGSAAGMFGNFLNGMQGKIGSALNRSGYQQQGQHNLAAQTAAADASSSAQNQMGKIYGQNLDNNLARKRLQTQMLGALS